MVPGTGMQQQRGLVLLAQLPLLAAASSPAAWHLAISNLRPQLPCWQQQQQVRCISEEKLGADADAVADLFQRNLLKASRKKPEDGRPRILTTRREAIALYREVLRYSNLFVWQHPSGRPWREVIRTSTRKEYEEARFEQDPELINKLIITGRESVQRTMEMFAQRRKQIIDEEAAAQDQRNRMR